MNRYPTPWKAEADDANCRAVVKDANNIPILYIVDPIRPRALEDAEMLCDMAKENADLRRKLISFYEENGGMADAGKGDKPPIGLRPKFVAEQHRAIEILDAMRRYAEHGFEVPLEWREELEGIMNDPSIWKRKSEKEGKV